MEKENFSDKLKVFLKKSNLKQKDLAESLGVNHATVSNLVNGRTQIGKATAMRWNEITGIDPLWLMTQGDQGTAPDEAAPSTDTPKPKGKGAPIISDLVGYLGAPLADGQVAMMTEAVTGYMSVPGIDTEGTVFLPVVGDSMTDDTESSIPNGSFVSLKPSTLSTFRWGEVYALVTDDGVLIKKVMPGKDDDHIVCESYNSAKYPPFTLIGREIKAVWRVSGVVVVRPR